jgi:hypothetical protein
MPTGRKRPVGGMRSLAGRLRPARWGPQFKRLTT